jgi:aldehyde dehydrogenase (NAD+)
MKPRLDEHYKLFIDGKWVDSSCGKTFTATNPSNGETLATCSNGCAEDVDFAVDAAWAAFPA